MFNSRKKFTLQKKIIRIMVGAHPRTPCRCLFKKLEILLVPCQFLIINKIFKQIHQYTVLIQGISTIFIDQLPTYHAFRKVHSSLASEFSTVYHVVSQILGMKRHNLM
jgi:hypothetical protein